MWRFCEYHPTWFPDRGGESPAAVHAAELQSMDNEQQIDLEMHSLAVHEAAHAVTHWHFRHQVVAATLNKDNERFSAAVWARRHDATVFGARQDMIVYAAGNVALGKPLDGDDLDRIKSLAQSVRGMLDKDGIEEEVRQAHAAAIALCKAYCIEIQSVANSLLGLHSLMQSFDRKFFNVSPLLPEENQMARTKQPPAQQTAVETVAEPIAPIRDPRDILAERKARRKTEGWHRARELLTMPTLSEDQVIECADSLEKCGIDAAWMHVFRAAIQYHDRESTKTGRTEQLAAEREQARENAKKAVDVRDRERDRLDRAVAQAQGVLHGAIMAAQDAMQTERAVNSIREQFAPLFDAELGLDAFALPRSASVLPLEVCAPLEAGNLIADGRPVALTVAERMRPQPQPMLHRVGNMHAEMVLEQRQPGSGPVIEHYVNGKRVTELCSDGTIRE
jgi:hypothetical protein